MFIYRAWLSLDKDDTQSARFLIYLLAVFQNIDPQIGRDAAGVSRSGADGKMAGVM